MSGLTVCLQAALTVAFAFVRCCLLGQIQLAEFRRYVVRDPKFGGPESAESILLLFEKLGRGEKFAEYDDSFEDVSPEQIACKSPGFAGSVGQHLSSSPFKSPDVPPLAELKTFQGLVQDGSDGPNVGKGAAETTLEHESATSGDELQSGQGLVAAFCPPSSIVQDTGEKTSSTHPTRKEPTLEPSEVDIDDDAEEKRKQRHRVGHRVSSSGRLEVETKASGKCLESAGEVGANNGKRDIAGSKQASSGPAAGSFDTASKKTKVQNSKDTSKDTILEEESKSFSALLVILMVEQSLLTFDISKQSTFVASCAKALCVNSEQIVMGAVRAGSVVVEVQVESLPSKHALEVVYGKAAKELISQLAADGLGICSIQDPKTSTTSIEVESVAEPKSFASAELVSEQRDVADTERRENETALDARRRILGRAVMMFAILDVQKLGSIKAEELTAAFLDAGHNRREATSRAIEWICAIDRDQDAKDNEVRIRA